MQNMLEKKKRKEITFDIMFQNLWHFQQGEQPATWAKKKSNKLVPGKLKKFT